MTAEKQPSRREQMPVSAFESARRAKRNASSDRLAAAATAALVELQMPVARPFGLRAVAARELDAALAAYIARGARE